MTIVARTPRCLTFTIPLVPPSVNHYMQHTRRGRHYPRKDAKAFLDAMGWMAPRSRAFTAEHYTVEIGVALGKGQKGDVDNFPKLVLDGLVKCGLLPSDAKVTRLVVEKWRDATKPRTEILIREIP